METLLKQIGLTAYEAKIYLTLLEFGRLDARVISDNSSVPKTAVYPNLKFLEDKGLITKFSGETMLFEAIQPKTAIPAYLEKKRNETLLLEKDLVTEAEQRFHKKQIEEKKEVVSLSVGKESSTAVYRELWGKAEDKIYMLGWRAHTIGNKYSFIPKLATFVKKGLDVRLIVTGNPKKKQWKLLQAIHDAGIKVRFVSIDNFSIVVVDGKECKITLKDYDLPEKFNVHVRDSSLAKAMESYFLTTWESAEKLNFEKIL
jgi:HTH-type transcriptional regulator, sugar sensing transcriptional regulator